MAKSPRKHGLATKLIVLYSTPRHQMLYVSPRFHIKNTGQNTWVLIFKKKRLHFCSLFWKGTMFYSCFTHVSQADIMYWIFTFLCFVSVSSEVLVTLFPFLLWPCILGFISTLTLLPNVPEMLAVLCVEIQVPPSPNKDVQKTKMKLNVLSRSVLAEENWKTRYVMFSVCFIREPFTVKKSIYLARYALPGMHAVNAFCKAQN